MPGEVKHNRVFHELLRRFGIKTPLPELRLQDSVQLVENLGNAALLQPPVPHSVYSHGGSIASFAAERSVVQLRAGGGGAVIISLAVDIAGVIERRAPLAAGARVVDVTAAASAWGGGADAPASTLVAGTLIDTPGSDGYRFVPQAADTIQVPFPVFCPAGGVFSYHSSAVTQTVLWGLLWLEYRPDFND